jgi:hypothetical protein
MRERERERKLTGKGEGEVEVGGEEDAPAMKVCRQAGLPGPPAQPEQTPLTNEWVQTGE